MYKYTWAFAKASLHTLLLQLKAKDFCRYCKIPEGKFCGISWWIWCKKKKNLLTWLHKNSMQAQWTLKSMIIHLNCQPPMNVIDQQWMSPLHLINSCPPYGTWWPLPHGRARSMSSIHRLDVNKHGDLVDSVDAMKVLSVCYAHNVITRCPLRSTFHFN